MTTRSEITEANNCITTAGKCLALEWLFLRIRGGAVVMTPTPAGLQAYKKKQKSSKSTTPSQQADTRHETNPSLLRLRKKLATGCIRYIRLQALSGRQINLVQQRACAYCLESGNYILQRTDYPRSCCSSTEKHVLQMLETQSVAQAKAAARAKTAIRQAAQADLEPLTRAQMLAKYATHLPMACSHV